MVQARDCQGYGVYEGVGAAASMFPAPPVAQPVPSRPLVLHFAAPSSLAPTPAISAGSGAPQGRVSFAPRPVRPGFRLVLQPVRRRVAVPIVLPRLAPPAARAAAVSLAAPSAAVVLPGMSSSQQVLTVALPGVVVVPGAPTIGFTQHGNLWIVDPTQLAAVSALLRTMSYAPYDVPDVDSVGAHGVIVVGEMPAGSDAWSNVQARNAEGFAVVVEKASIPTGTLNFIVTQSPASLASLAGGPSAPFALVTDQPSVLVDQADQALTPVPPQLVLATIPPAQPGACPPGTTGMPPDCVPVPTQATMAAASPVGWWARLSTMEKVAGLGALALVGYVVATRGKKKPS